MVAAVVDTHAAIWFFSGDPRLSVPAKESFYRAAANRQKIALSSISLAEVVYLVEKSRLPPSAYDDLRQALANPNHILQEAVFNAEVVEVMRKISRIEVPDMPDRIVAATAVYLGVPVITRDGRIRASNVQTLW